MDINSQLLSFKNIIENSIIANGVKGKENAIKSSILINLIHDAVKNELILKGVDPANIIPSLGSTKPEIKLAGFLKQKNQDICVIPRNIKKEISLISWGPMQFENKEDEYGIDFSTNILVINIRSQMSSLAKNADTLFERTFAEALNLHLRYPKIVLGEVYLIPLHEYDDDSVKRNEVAFKTKQTNVEKYISFFSSLNNRRVDRDDYAYERCALLIVDFNRSEPYLFKNSNELKVAGIVSSDFSIEYADLNFQDFAEDILKVYSRRHNIANILKQNK